ncbi:MAG: toxin HicA [Pseudomonadota bacterium]
MTNIVRIVQQMKTNPSGIRFEELKKACEYYFGKPRQSSGSHRIFKTPWPGNPRVNIQNNKGKAKRYQVKQVLLAIEKFEADYDSGNG